MCVREQLDRLWNTKRPTCVLSFLNGWIDALRWQRLTDMDRLGEFVGLQKVWTPACHNLSPPEFPRLTAR
jgi:hypothetical protein